MKIFRIDDLKSSKNPNSAEKLFRSDALTEADGAFNLGAISVIQEPGAEPNYHYHEKRESVLVVVSGEAIENVEGKDYDLKAGDIIFLKANEKHSVRNKSTTEQMRFIEFFTEPPAGKDFVTVKK